MISLEDKLRPPLPARAWPRDLLGLLLLGALAAVLLPSLGVDWRGSLVRIEKLPDSAPPAAVQAYADLSERKTAAMESIFDKVTAPMAAIYLLPALGLLLCLRRGAIDLSVWIAACLGGLVAAWMIRAGAPTALGLAAGTLTGAALGAINGALTVLARVPSLAATAVTALIGTGVVWKLTGGADVPVPDAAFVGWALRGSNEGQPDQPLILTRMLLVVLAYSTAMFVLLGAGFLARRGVRFGRRTSLLAALCASGALSAGGGALWLLDHGQATALSRPVGDLRVAAAAILAGGAFFGGRGRTMLAAACLPGALLLTTAWRQNVWNFQIEGFAVQTALLIAMTIVAHSAMVQALAGLRVPKPAAILGMVMTVSGILITAGAANVSDAGLRRTLLWVGVGLWLVGAARLLVSRALAMRARGSGH